MDISIIVPVYNKCKYVDDCIRSILTQDTTLDVELIIVDDCSTDPSMNHITNLLNSSENKFSHNVLLHNKRKGVSTARNTGVNAAKGEYILFVDADDILSNKDALNLLWNEAKRGSYDIVCGGTDLITPTDKELRYFNKLSLVELTDDAYMQKYFAHVLPFNVWNKLIKKSFLDDNDIKFNDDICDNGDLWNFYVSLAKPKTYVMKSKTYTYRNIPKSGRELRQTAIEEDLKAVLEKIEIILEKKLRITSFMASNIAYSIKFILDDILKLPRDIAFLKSIAMLLAKPAVQTFKRLIGPAHYEPIKDLESCIEIQEEFDRYDAITNWMSERCAPKKE